MKKMGSRAFYYVYKYKRYEDSSLSYAGIDRHEGEKMVGGYSTVITMEEYLSS